MGTAPKRLTPNAFLSIDGRGGVDIFVARFEMGQGVCTAIPMIIADDWGPTSIASTSGMRSRMPGTVK